MTRHKTLSSLSIAVTAILAAAVSCFAQAQSSEFSAKTPTVSEITMIEPTLALNRTGPTAEMIPGKESIARKSVTAVTTSPKRPTLSAAMFKQSAEQFSAGESQRFVAPQTTIYDRRADDAKQQFRTDDYDGPASHKRITFVPSRGQKLPDDRVPKVN